MAAELFELASACSHELVDNDVEAAVASYGINGRSNVSGAMSIADVIGEANVIPY